MRLHYRQATAVSRKITTAMHVPQALLPDGEAAVHRSRGSHGAPGQPHPLIPVDMRFTVRILPPHVPEHHPSPIDSQLPRTDGLQTEHPDCGNRGTVSPDKMVFLHISKGLPAPHNSGSLQTGYMGMYVLKAVGQFHCCSRF
jgi:hypothetical protein